MANKFSTKIKTPEHYILWEKEKTSWQTLIIIAETLMLLAILITIEGMFSPRIKSDNFQITI